MPATIAPHHPHHPHLTVPGSHLSGRALVWSALAAGTVFLVLELLVTRYVMGLNPGVMLRMIAAITQGSAMLPPPQTADVSITLAALILHFVMSLTYALFFAFIAKGRAIRTAALLGAGYGLLLYALNFYGFTELFPWFAGARNWGALLAHVVFGTVLGATYAYWATHDRHHAA